MNKETVQQISEELKPALEKIAEQLGTTADKVWEITVAQAQVFAISEVIGIVNMLLILTLLISITKKAVSMAQKDNKNEAVYLPWLIVAVFCGFGASICATEIGIALSNTTSILTALFNPEYWAYQDILNKL